MSVQVLCSPVSLKVKGKMQDPAWQVPRLPVHPLKRNWAICVLISSVFIIAEVQIKPNKKSDQTKNLDRLYIWVVGRLVVVTIRI